MELSKVILLYLSVLIWPITVIVIIFLFRNQVVLLINRIRHAELPGGLTLDLVQEIKEVKSLSSKVQEQPAIVDRKEGRPSIPLTEANARMIQLDLRPSPSGLDMSYYRELAKQDPNVALAGLRPRHARP